MQRLYSSLLLAGLVLLFQISINVSFAQQNQTSNKKNIEAQFIKIDEFIKQQIQVDDINAVVLNIYQGGKQVHQFAFNQNADSQFVIGSLSKSFTALAIMQLVEAGLIDVQQTMDVYLPSSLLSNNTKKKYPTVHQLLSQTSGFSTAQGLDAWPRVFISLDTRVGELVEQLQEKQIQASFEYSNSNYTLLSKIVEFVSGQNFTDYIDQHIFKPLNMQNSFADINHPSIKLAPAYNYFLGFAYQSEYKQSNWRAGEAKMVSTANDYGKYLQWQLNPKSHPEVLSAKGLVDLRDSTKYSNYYNAGWFRNNSGSMFSHSGSVENSLSYTVFFPKRDLAIIVFINGIDFVFGVEKSNLGRNIRDMYFGYYYENKTDNGVAPKVLYVSLLLIVIQLFMLRLLIKTQQWVIRSGLVLLNVTLWLSIIKILYSEFNISLTYARIIMPDLGWFLTVNCLLVLVTVLLFIFLTVKSLMAAKRNDGEMGVK
ncbi:MAG: beta-lactamase family protein [Saccharospirillaceae bacterium]|nr:beta-lactamase family protein [Pseudomonadales bacterium]NRB80407.1 beta-lactamase family protein [Saccharospirillaceae bacterium]